ncbi:MAG: ADP-ribosylation factor-like protein, partial [Candidatus Lokiarchaeota archaeon]
MLRQLHVFLKSDLIFTHTYAMAIGDEEVDNIKKILKSFLEIPMPGKTFQLPGSNFQIFHRSKDNLVFVLITDLIDNRDYIEKVLIRIIDKFITLIPDPKAFDRNILHSEDVLNFLNEIQHKMHSKIAIMGPFNSGKTYLYNMLKNKEERDIADFAKVSTLNIHKLKFDIWDFQLPENYHGLWSKFIKGSDLIVLLFDVSNFNLNVIEHFLQLFNQESKLSKLLVIGNKTDLVNEEEIRLSSNLLKIGKFQTISLK